MHSRRWALLAALTVAILFSFLAGSVKAQADENEIVYIETSNSVAIKSLEKNPNLQVRHKFRGGFSAKVSKKLSKQLRKQGYRVRAVPEYHPTVLPDDQTPYGIEQIYDNANITATSGGSGITIGHLDTGVDASHPDLMGRIVGCKDATASIPLDDARNDRCTDSVGHGTHTAGSAVADGGPNGTGIYGVAPEANLYVVKVCRNNSCMGDDIAQAIHFLGSNNLADVVTMSIGGNTFSQDIANAISSYSSDILIVAASGNDGPNEGSIDYPAWDKNVVAVGAIDSNKVVPNFSSRGLSDPAQGKMVELAAAGVGVLSTVPGGDYLKASGTSMATPHIAGLAAREWQGNPDATRKHLISLAEDIIKANGGGAGNGFDIASGYGLGHVASVAPPTITALEVLPNSASIDVGDTQNFGAFASYSDGSRRNVTLEASWGSSDDTIASVNDSSNPGVATGISQGLVDITARFDGLSSSAKLEVLDVVPPSLVALHISPEKASIKEGHTQAYSAKAEYDDGNTANVTKLVAWNSSDNGVASFADASMPGVAIGIAEGVTKIIASLDGMDSNVASLEVTAEPMTEATMHIGDLDSRVRARKNWWRAKVTVRAHDANDNPLAGVRINGRWSLPLDSQIAPSSGKSNGMTKDLMRKAFGDTGCTTNRKGECNLLSPVVLNAFSSVQFEVTNAKHETLTYDPSENHDSDGDSDGTVIKIAKPRK